MNEKTDGEKKTIDNFSSFRIYVGGFVIARGATKTRGVEVAEVKQRNT